MNRRKVDDSKIYSQMYNKWVRYDKLVSILSMLGLAAKIVAFELDVRRFNELNFRGLGVHTEEEIHEQRSVMRELARNSGRNNSYYCEPIKYFCFITTVLAIIFLSLKRYHEVVWTNKYLMNFINQPQGSLFFFYHQSIYGDQNNIDINDSDPHYIDKKRIFSTKFKWKIFILMFTPIPHYEFLLVFTQYLP